ncbi:MAG: histidine phosphatase family protein [Nocardioides sp.]
MSDLHCPARVFLARHADTSYDGGERLTAAGEQQTRDLAARLRGERLAGVHASVMPRAAQTAQVAAAALGLEVELHDGLAEVGVESEDAVVERVSAALAGIADLYRGEAVLVVGHQAALGLTLRRLLAGAPTVGLDPGEVVALEHDADGWALRSARTDTSAGKN